jgi:hypothetical protein
MTKITRHFAKKKKLDDAKLRRLWSTHMTEGEIAKQMGHSRGTLRRRAVKIGLRSSRREIWSDQA